MARKKILVTGSIAYDLLLDYEGSFKAALESTDLEKLSVAFVTPHFRRHHGGTGANISWNLALLGRQPLLVGTVGDDGKPYLALLRERGVQTDHVEVLDGHATSMAILATDNAERQIILFHPGADARGTWPDLADDREEIAYAIVGPRDASLMQQAMQWCKEEKLPALFDPGQQIHTFSKDELLRAIKGSGGLVVNAYEWSVVSQKLNCTEANFLQHAPLLIITQGEDGVTLIDADGVQKIAACPPDHVVNPTGAGDAFRAGLLSGLSAGWSVRDACRLGAAMGSFCVEAEGTLLDTLDLDILRTRAEQTYGEKLPPL